MAESGSAPPKRAQADAGLGMTKMVIARSPDVDTAETLLNRGAEPPQPVDSAKQTERVEGVHSDTLPRVGRYVLLRKLGEGGMGVVYSAYDQELDRKVALKIIHPERQQDPELRTRILREAQALARVSAPNVIHVYQVGEVDGQLFIAMEFVSGTTLSKWQGDPKHSWQDVLRMYIAAGQGLQAAHEAGLVHRGLQP
jgi:serine/threonine protein kinase